MNIFKRLLKKEMQPPTRITPQQFIDDDYAQHIANKVLGVHYLGKPLARVKRVGRWVYHLHPLHGGVTITVWKSARLDVTYSQGDGMPLDFSYRVGWK